MMPPASRASSAPARFQGKIVEWNITKAYGFADDGRNRVFIHVRDFAERHKAPELGDILVYEIGTDATGRTCAKNIRHANNGGRLRAQHVAFLAALLALPGFATWRLTAPVVTQWLAGWILTVSSVCYGFYAWDKHKARTGNWRIPEKMLHCWELLGGWPGGFIAQRRLRHKSSKSSYLLVFWLIVVSHNYAAADWLLDWRMSRATARTIRTWLNQSP